MSEENSESVAVPETPGEEALCRPSPGIVAWPFVAYLGAWATLAVATGLLLTGSGAAAAPVEDPSYPFLLLAGLTLAACGPLLVVTVWAVSLAGAEKECRGGLFTKALFRGAAATLLGVVVWWGSLLFVDATRLGLI